MQQKRSKDEQFDIKSLHLQAVLFVRDLDRGLLGRGSNGLQQYEMLRRGTDALVNGILRVRRLLKQKRTADVDGVPAPHACTPWQCLPWLSLLMPIVAKD